MNPPIHTKQEARNPITNNYLRPSCSLCLLILLLGVLVIYAYMHPPYSHRPLARLSMMFDGIIGYQRELAVVEVGDFRISYVQELTEDLYMTYLRIKNRNGYERFLMVEHDTDKVSVYVDRIGDKSAFVTRGARDSPNTAPFVDHGDLTVCSGLRGAQRFSLTSIDFESDSSPMGKWIEQRDTLEFQSNFSLGPSQ